jgi:hypothetical protein
MSLAALYNDRLTIILRMHHSLWDATVRSAMWRRAAHRAEITLLAARYCVPAVYWSRFFAEVGGLLSYGVNPLSEFRRAASYADRIVNGAKPSSGNQPIHGL